MPREVGPSLNERQFFLQALKEEIRIENRGFGDFRAIQLEFGDEYGVSDVRIGKTRFVLQLLVTMKLMSSITRVNRPPYDLSSLCSQQSIGLYRKYQPFKAEY